LLINLPPYHGFLFLKINSLSRKIIFSVIIPLYNKKKFIERCINSVLSQSFNKYEIIVIDDCSTDGSSEIVERLFPQIQLVRKKNGGVSSARNLGIEHSKEKFVAFLDADDYWTENYLKNLYNIIENYSDIKIIGTSYSSNENNLEHNEINSGVRLLNDYFSEAIYNTLFFTSAVVIKKDFFKSNLAFDINIKRGEDLDVWFRAILSGGKAVYVNAPLVFYSKEDETSLTNTTVTISESLVSKLSSKQYIYLAKNNPSFSMFRDNLIYNSVYLYIYDANNKVIANKVFSSIKERNFILDTLYSLPDFLWLFLLKQPLFIKIIRKLIPHIFKH
jgi:glycosyltransferase involved in cell wall biosynthesis